MQRTVELPSYFDSIQPIAFAHRGGDEKFPENTMAAFQDAYQLGYRHFETDVHYTIDKELVAFHDDNLARLLGVKTTIAELTKKQRRSITFGENQHVPLLTELFTSFPDVYFHIDAKSSAAVIPLAEVIKSHHAEGRVCVSSFTAKNVLQLRKLLPDVYTTATQRELAKIRYRTPIAKLPELHNRILSIPIYALHDRQPQRIALITPKSIKRFHSKGCKVFVWTINTEQEMHTLLDMGVDGIFTDKLRVLKKVLESRKQWVRPSSIKK
jgi:glycerophosphoryl diester phosphodiesterase